MLKAEAWPNVAAVPGWQAKARRFRDDAASRFSPSMRQRVDITKVYERALRAMPDAIDGLPALPVPADWRFTLDGLVG